MGRPRPEIELFLVYLLMFESLHSYITRYSTSPLNDEQFDKVRSVFRLRSLRKRQYFLQEGEVCQHFGFIIKGAMRQYTVATKGVEHIVSLSIENWWVGDRESWVMVKPSIYNIDAWEDTDLLVITKADVVQLSRDIPAMSEMVTSMDEKYAIAVQKRLTSSISFSAEERYADFANRYPDFIKRFPQHIIASYLGITKETLSRVRSRLVKK